MDASQYEMQKIRDGGGKMPKRPLLAKWRREHSKDNILCGTVYDSHENSKNFLPWTQA